MNKPTTEQEVAVNADVTPKFNIGDAVVHPIRGAGRITGFKAFETQGTLKQYYEINLLKQTNTSLMIPVGEADEIGMRRAVTGSEMETVWQVLEGEPEELPSNYRTRHKVINDRLQTGDVMQIAEAVRDAGWRRQTEDGLTQKGKELYKKGIRLLAAEIAVSQDTTLAKAKRQIKARLKGSFREINKTRETQS